MRLTIIITILALFLGGCASDARIHNMYANMSDQELLKNINMLGAGTITIYGSPGEMQGMRVYRFAVQEAEARGYTCNPTGCFKPKATEGGN